MIEGLLGQGCVVAVLSVVEKVEMLCFRLDGGEATYLSLDTFWLCLVFDVGFGYISYIRVLLISDVKLPRSFHCLVLVVGNSR